MTAPADQHEDVLSQAQEPPLSLRAVSERDAPRRVRPYPRSVRIAPKTTLDATPQRLARRREAWEHRYVARLVGLDAALAAAAALLALVLQLGDRLGSHTEQTLAALFPAVWVAALSLGRAYETRFLGAGGEQYRRVFDSAVRLFAVVAMLTMALRLAEARDVVVIAFPLATAFTLIGRNLSRRTLQRAQKAGTCRARVLIVGRERSISEMLVRLARGTAYKPVGVCLDRSDGPNVDGVPVVGSSRDVLAALRTVEADTVAVAAWSDLSQEDLRNLSWCLEGTGVDLLVAPSLTDIAGPRVTIRPEAGVPLLHVDEPVFEGPRRVTKGVFDRSIALMALLVAGPVMLALALAVRLDSRGPALFKQTRVGVKGRAFTIYKFRTMHVDAEERLTELRTLNEASDGLLFKMRDDPRITRVGRLLRRFSLDELPQLFNVLGGTMSLVGPRPPLPTEVDEYGEDVRRRLLVKPGLTGLWQISGRSDLPWAEAVRLDLHYVENWSPALDLTILWRTGGAVLARRGAY